MCTVFPFALNKDDRCVGNIITGVDYNKLRPFEALNFENQSSQECLECPVANGCGWCVGNNYNKNPNNTIFGRATAICKMHKARARANDYYWARMRSQRGVVRHVPNLDRKRFLYIMVSDSSVDYCSSAACSDSDKTISFSDFQRGLRYARENFYTPVIVYDKNDLNSEFECELENYEVLKIQPVNLAKQGENNDSIIVLNSGDVISLDGKNFIQVILHIRKADILNLNNLCKKLFACSRKVNIILDDWEDMTSVDFNNYQQALEEIADTIIACAENNQIVQINVLSDMMITSEKMNCGAGNTSFVLAPNAEFYPCISFYKDKKYQSMGNLNTGITDDISIYQMDNSPVCSICDISSCRKCVYNNIEKTREIKIPSIEQCKLRGIEKNVAVKLQKRLLEINPNTPFGRNKLKEQEYPEALEFIVAQKYAQYR